jgi:F0F1-type ATP synthase membrane subunit b/b'
MANILEFLRGLLTDAGEQKRFAGNPLGYVTAHGFPDLSGEDVTEAMRVVARTMPEGHSDHLSVYSQGDGEIPPVRPQVGETELDAAVRQLRFAISLSPAGSSTDMDTTEPEPETAEADLVVPEWPLPPVEPEQDPHAEGEREAVSLQTDTEATAMDSPAETPAQPAIPALDPYAAFGDEMASILRNAGEQMEGVLARAEAILNEAEREAEGIRESAQVDAQTVRGMANQEAEAVLQSARSQHEEADNALEMARLTREEAQRDAAEIVHNAERESNSMLSEARTKRDEIRAAEQELRKRLEGVQSVFQSLQQGSVVPDEL